MAAKYIIIATALFFGAVAQDGSPLPPQYSVENFQGMLTETVPRVIDQHETHLDFLVGVWAETPVNMTLPQGIQGSLDQQEIADLGNKSLSSFQAQCEKNGGPDAFDKAHNASIAFVGCIKNLVNWTKLQSEVETAKPKGQMDEVFKKYCHEQPSFEACVNALYNSTKDCFATDEQEHLKTVYNVTEELADFVCYKEGDRIAMFVSEGGQECFQNQTEELKQCWNKTVGMEAQDLMVEFHITFDEKQCNKMTELQHCVVKELEKCTKPTSANIVDSIFRFIRKATPCKNTQDVVDKQKGSASALGVTSATIIMAVATATLL